MGTNVGMLARDLFPGGVDVSPATPFEYQQSVADTAAQIAAGQEVIYEAAFQFEGVLAALDILVKKNGKWYGYEVKSSTKVKDTFIQDAALQYYIITNAGLQLEDLFLAHINNSYIRGGALDLECLFTRISLKAEVKSLNSFIETKLAELKSVIQQKKMPEVSPGNHCTKPYPCDFYGHCWKEVAEEIDHEIEQINKKELKGFLKQLEYPLYFMDFETYMVAVPEYDGHWPYRQVPFQFSVHKQAAPNAELDHHEFLASADCDPCPEFVERLINAMGNTGSIIVYNKTFENCRLNELKQQYPGFRKQIENIQDRLVDLMVPFRKKHLYLPSMKGSYSIKAVLPALVPEMSYESMAIANGGDASTAFYNLRFETDKAKAQNIRLALREYCKLDTFAMYAILQKLRQVVK
jgi:hypothetical protein